MASKLFVVVSFVFCVTCDAGKRINFLKLGSIGESDVKAQLERELAGLSNLDMQGRLKDIEDALRPMYDSLPKNAEGTLEHLAVRYALHRFFNNRSGWFIRGLEPNAEPAEVAQSGEDREWIPAFLQKQLEQRLGGKPGATLEQLAALAAALEDLVHVEAAGRLEGVFEMHGFDKGTSLSENQMQEVLGTYYISFLLAGNFSAGSLWEVHKKQELFRAKYTGWAEAEEWLEKLLAKSIPQETRVKGLSFEQVSQAVNDVGEKYYSFNDLECNDLKQTLRGMEGRKPGRVRLAAFYNTGMYSHWQFTEKVDYLRSLGALDESDSQRPYVIIANYAMARPNCLDSSSLYAICCRNDCESLMGSLEAEIGTATAPPQRVAELVAKLPSAFVEAPRNLSETLMTRLEDVAKQNGGEVPLHGRLFAQFMHHAFPSECPYPHEKGTINPQTPDEWIRQTGHTEQIASTEEMLKHVESDTCAVSFKGKIECAGESDEIPWTSNEELLSSRRDRESVVEMPRSGAEQKEEVPHQLPSTQVEPQEGRRGGFGGRLGLLAIFLAVIVALGARSARGFARLLPHLKEDDDTTPSALGLLLTRISWRPIMGLFALAGLAVTLGLLDGLVVCIGALIGLVAVVVGSLGEKQGRKDKATKCDV